MWYFPANVPHAVLGLAPKGCTFVSGFRDGGFDELDSFSASSWLATLPVDTLALVSAVECKHCSCSQLALMCKVCVTVGCISADASASLHSRSLRLYCY